MNLSQIILLAISLTICVHVKAEVLVSKNSVGLSEIVQMTIQKYETASLPEEMRKSKELEAKSLSTFDNPVLSIGKGRLEYNGGTGRADYDEFSISQKIPINGRKTSLRRQGSFLGKLGELEGQMLQFKLSSQAILAALRFYTDLEKNSHAKERLQSLKLVSQYLKSRKFQSPKQRIEIQLIENKIDEILFETRRVTSDLKSSRQNLELYIGDFKDKSILLKPIEEEKAQQIIIKTDKEKILQDQRFKHLNEVLELKYKAATKKWIPDLELYYTNSNERFSGGNYNQVFGIGIEVPLFNYGKNKKAAIVAQKAASRIEFELSKNEALNNRNENLALINSALEFLRIYTDRKISSNDKKLLQFKADFQKGLISASSFLELEDQDHRIHNEKLNSYVKVYGGLLNLIEISGDTTLLKEIL